MYFKRWVIILTLGVYNLNVQKMFTNFLNGIIYFKFYVSMATN